MAPTQRAPPIQHGVIAGFFLGAASSALTRKHKISLEEIYTILNLGIQKLSPGPKISE
jgi:hypothetical protein